MSEVKTTQDGWHYQAVCEVHGAVSREYLSWGWANRAALDHDRKLHGRIDLLAMAKTLREIAADFKPAEQGKDEWFPEPMQVRPSFGFREQAFQGRKFQPGDRVRHVNSDEVLRVVDVEFMVDGHGIRSFFGYVLSDGSVAAESELRYEAYPTGSEVRAFIEGQKGE
jgi:hypothetical protein